MCCCHIPVLEQGRNAFNTRLSMVIQSQNQASQIDAEMTSHMFGQGRHDVLVRRRLPMFSTVCENQRIQHQLLNPVWLTALALRAFCNVLRFHTTTFARCALSLYFLAPRVSFLRGLSDFFEISVFTFYECGWASAGTAWADSSKPLSHPTTTAIFDEARQ